MLKIFSSINYMSGRTSSTCSKCRPSRLGDSDFVCLTPLGLLTILSYRGVHMKDLECCMDWFPSLMCKNYIFKHFVKTVEVTSLKLRTLLKLLNLHLERTIA